MKLFLAAVFLIAGILPSLAFAVASIPAGTSPGSAYDLGNGTSGATYTTSDGTLVCVTQSGSTTTTVTMTIKRL